MTYFQGITDFKKAKEQYRSLAKRLHPDRGGNSTHFQEMKNEYALLLDELKNDSSPDKPESKNYYEEIKAEMEQLGFSPEFIKRIEGMVGGYVSSVLKDITGGKDNPITDLLKHFL